MVSRDDEVVDVIALSSSVTTAPGFNLPTPGGGYGSSPPGGMGVTSQGFGQEGYLLDTSEEGGMPKPRPEEFNFEVGVPYYLPFTTPYRDSWEIFRDDPVTVRQLQSMRRQDGQARALYRLVTMPILAALKNCVIRPPEQYEAPAGAKINKKAGQGKPDSQDASEETEYIHNLFFLPSSSGGMTHTFSHFIRRMLLATFDGYSGFEMVYWVPTTGPMKGKVTLRKIDWRPSETITFLLDGQGEFNGFRQRCHTSETEIEQLNGTSVRIDEMVRRHQAGREQWVYSCTEDGRIVPGRVKDARKVSDSEPIVEVLLDNGKKVRCTYTHPLMLRDGTYRRAANVLPGDSLMPLYRRLKKPSERASLYEQVWHPGTGRWEYTHRMVSRELGFAGRGGEVIHHWFDGLGSRNNDPRNLERMTSRQHSQLHADLGGNIRKAHAAFMALSPEERSRIGSERARTRWQNPEYRAGGKDRLAAAKAVSDPDRWGRHVAVTFEDIDQVSRAVIAAGKRLTWQAVGEKLSCSQDVIYARVRDAGYESWKQYKWTLVQRDRKWERKTAAPQNHKVAVVRFCDPEPVYDIEVEEYHNFALTAGIISHNTFFQGRTIDVKIPKQRAFYFANNEEERPFYGVSLFEAAFYHYDKKVKLYYITHLAAQRAAVGLRIGTMPPNPAHQDKVNFVAAMRDLGMNQYIVVPSEDWTVTSLNESQGASFDFLGLINHHNNQMSKSVLASWFDNDAGKGKSESTLVDFGTQNDETFMMMETAIMDDIAAKINRHIIPRFIDWNFGSGKYPEFHFGALTEDQQSAVQDIFEKIGTAPPGTISPEFIMALEKKMAKILGMEIDYAPIEQKAKEDADLRRSANQATLRYQAKHPEGPPPAAANKPGGSTAGKSGSTAGRSSSSSSSSKPKPKSSSAKMSARDQALVSLVGDVLVDLMGERVSAGSELDG